MSFTSLARVIALATALALIAGAPAQADTVDYLDGCDSAWAEETVTADDGSIFVSGEASGCDGLRMPIVIKLTPGGTVDTNWAEGGLLRLWFGADEIGISVLQDGSLVYGYANYLAKFDPTGEYDQSFGEYGYIEMDSILPDERSIQRFTTDSQGRIVILASGDSGALLARVKPNGELDGDFGTGGIAAPAVPSAGFTGARALVIDGLGRIVFAGRDGLQGGAMRLLADGTPDTSFGPSDDGYAKASASSDGQVVDVTIGPADSIQIVQIGDGGIYCYGLTYVSSLDANGDPTVGASGAKGCQVNDWIPVNRDGYAGDAIAYSSNGRGVPTSFGVSVSPAAGQGWHADGPVSPDEPGAEGLEYVPENDRIVAAGYGSGGNCAKADCPLEKRMVIRRFELDGGPDAEFGKSGIVYLPEPTCKFGQVGKSPQPGWKRCRVKPPQPIGSATIKGRRSPIVNAQVTLIGPPGQPGALTQRISIGIPSKLRLRKGLGTRNLVASAVSEAEGKLAVKVAGRKVILTYAADYKDNMFMNYFRNEPVEFNLKFKRGTFKPLGANVRVRKLWVPGRAANIPVGDSMIKLDYRATAWYEANYAEFGLRVRP